jgi:hypothetical protein
VHPVSLNSDPDTVPDLAFQVNLDPIRIQGFDDPKKIQLKIIFYLLLIKIAIYLCPSYRRNLQLAKENIEHFKN